MGPTVENEPNTTILSLSVAAFRASRYAVTGSDHVLTVTSRRRAGARTPGRTPGAEDSPAPACDGTMIGAAPSAAAAAAAGSVTRLTISASLSADRPRSPASPAQYQWSMRLARRRTTPSTSLSAYMPNTACVDGYDCIASRLCPKAAAACGLWATSSTMAGKPGRICMRPGNDTCDSPMRTACCGTARLLRSASMAASAADAFSSWLAPRSAGYARLLRRWLRPP